MGSDCSKEQGAVATGRPTPPSSNAPTPRGSANDSTPKQKKQQQPSKQLPSLQQQSKQQQAAPSRTAPKVAPASRTSMMQKGFKASNYNFAHERARTSIESASERSRSEKPMGVMGFRNMGNTCYMNASLQCMSATIPLTDYFLGDAHKGEINQSNPLGSKGELVKAFAKITRDMWIDAPASRVLRPTSFKTVLERFASQFKGTRQHDAQEFLSILLDGIHEDLNRVKKKPYIEIKDCDGTNDTEDAIEAWKNYLRRDKSVIVDIFQGQLRNRLKCLTCGHQNIRFEAVMYLSLPIDESCESLDDCLRLYLREERLTGENQWYCSKCKQHRDATKKIDLWILPPILIIHFKRFRTNDFGLVASKNNAPVEFPLLDWMVGSYIKNKDGFAPCYDLYAVANHMGQLGQGHYTSYCLHRMDDRWYEFNDSSTQPIDADEIHRNRSSAYVLFYNRVSEEESVQSNGSSNRSTPMVRRQSVSRPDLWPHAEVVDQRYRSFSRSSNRSNRQLSVTDSPLVSPSKSKPIVEYTLPPRNEVLEEESKDFFPPL